MIADLLFLFAFIGLALGGLSTYVDAHIGIDKLTQNIETHWLRTTIRVALKIGTATLLLVGFACSIICLLALKQPKRGRRRY